MEFIIKDYNLNSEKLNAAEVKYKESLETADLEKVFCIIWRN
jgi:hypothetical protein